LSKARRSSRILLSISTIYLSSNSSLCLRCLPIWFDILLFIIRVGVQVRYRVEVGFGNIVTLFFRQ